LTALGVGAVAQPAWAHNVLISSDPAKGAKIAEAPGRSTLTFNGNGQDGPGNQIVVNGPDGKQYTDPEGEVTVDGPEAGGALEGLGPAGEYTIGYRIVSADGHVVQNKLTFTLTKDDPANAGREPSDGGSQSSADTAAQAEESDGLPLWVWIGGAVVLVGVGLVFALRVGKDQS